MLGKLKKIGTGLFLGSAFVGPRTVPTASVAGAGIVSPRKFCK